MEQPTSLTTPLAHYETTLIIITLYGTQVCPFLESLGLFELAIPIFLIITLQYLLRHLLLTHWVNNAIYKKQVARVFYLEIGLFLLSGILITMITTWFYHFPLSSGLKLVLGFSAIGFFVAIDLSLQRERQLAEHFAKQNITQQPDQRFLSLVKKFSLFAAVAAFYLVLIFFLLINKDLDWLKNVGQSIPFASAQQAIIGEFAFVGIVLLGYILLVIRAFANNLQHFFKNQNGALHAATHGNLQCSIPVSSNDEFGVMAHHTNVMIKTLDSRTQELLRTRDITIHSLASLAETRDNETGAHILRTQRYVRALANQLSQDPKHQALLTAENRELLYKSAPLHDIGKVGIPDAILLKPGKLTDDEFAIMKTHAALGGEALTRAEEQLGGSSFLRFAREIAMTHHEKWDGSGYPKGLKGEEIPLSGRLMAVADVYDALISKRVYKPAFPHEKAMQILLQGRGSHFDPEVIDALRQIEPDFIEIAEKYQDRE